MGQWLCHWAGNISKKNQSKLQSLGKVCAFDMKTGGRQVTVSLLVFMAFEVSVIFKTVDRAIE